MLDLLDYRRKVTNLYRTVREDTGDPAARWAWFCREREAIFRQHPQSALDDEQKKVFQGLRYYSYDPAFRVMGSVDLNVEPQEFHIDVGDDGFVHYRRFGRVRFDLPTGSGQLSLFWIMGYGGGVFIPVGDATNKTTTYGAGRYLYDTIKGADLGASQHELLLDFNYAYNPSCAYNPRWVCPLAPLENRLPFPVPVGEQRFEE